MPICLEGHWSWSVVRMDLLAPFLISDLERHGASQELIRNAQSLKHSAFRYKQKDIEELSRKLGIESQELMDGHVQYMTSRFTRKMSGIISSYLMKDTGHFAIQCTELCREAEALSLKRNREGKLVPYSAANAVAVDRMLDVVIARATELKNRIADEFFNAETSSVFIEQREAGTFCPEKKTKKRKARRRKSSPIYVKGKPYASLTELAQQTGKAERTLYSRIRDKGLLKAYQTNTMTDENWNSVLSEPPAPNKGPKAANKPITYKGDSYPTLNHLAEAANLTYSALYQRLRHRELLEKARCNELSDMDWEKVLNAIPPNRKADVEIVINGKGYPSVAAVATNFGLAESTLSERLKQADKLELAKENKLTEEEWELFLVPPHPGRKQTTTKE
jgi:hypothetical protein|nr:MULTISPECIES: hypothetical protein [Vibrio harveyi group]